MSNRYDYLLIFKFLTINVIGLSFLFLSYLNGWIDLILISDPTYICVLIFAMFLWGWCISFTRVFKTSQEINYIKSNNPKSKWLSLVIKMKNHEADSGTIIETLKTKMVARISLIRWIANILVVLGLIGTVVGFIMALSGVNPSIIGDVAMIGPMVASMVEGMGTALYTTLVGALLNIWLSAIHQILAEGSSNLLTTIMEKGQNIEYVE